MTQFSAPLAVPQNVARAKSLVKRDEPVRAIDSLVTALELFEPAKILGKARYEIEVNILECVADLSRHPAVKTLLTQLTRSNTAVIAYTPGEEAKLIPVLKVLRKALAETAAEKIRAEEGKATDRKASLLTKGKEHLAAGEMPKARAVLKRLAEEFGTEPGVLAEIGSILTKANLQYEAVEFLEQALEAFPKESGVYAELVGCYVTLREHEKAEAVYLKAIAQFGRHPRTLINLGKLYLEWNKKDKAFDVLNQAVGLDPKNEEAKKLRDQAEGR